MALTGLYSINGSTSALEDKGLRDFISTASGSWTGGGSSGPVTSTGGTTTYIQTINNLNISASNAGSAVSATKAYNATNAYNLTNTAIKVASATSANYALAVSNGVTSTTARSIIYTASLPGSPNATTLYLIPE